jgi:metal-dependent amidase/aminoacylase/carboxypeptidase family protein
MTYTIPYELRAAVRQRRPVLERVSLDLHGHPETRFEEHHAAERLTAELAAAEFDVEKGVAELPTAFVATHRGATEGPTIAVLLEYDALPGIGHGCGHNLIAAGGLTAALAAVAVRPDHPGTLKVIGTPARRAAAARSSCWSAGSSTTWTPR